MPMFTTDLVHLSMERIPSARREAERVPTEGKDPLEMLMDLEEEMGCSIVQAVHRYRESVRESRTVDNHC